MDKIRGWLRDALDASGTKQARLSRDLGLPQDAINKVLRGVRDMSADELLRAARIMGVNPPLDIGTSGATGGVLEVAQRRPSYLKVVGEVAGGAWLQMNYIDFEEIEIPYVADPRWPPSAVNALRVRGESVNRHARDGDYVVVLDAAAAPRAFEAGDWVVVHRHRGDLVECTVKQVRGAPGAWELWPDSTDPRFQEPVRLNDVSCDEVRVVGFVLEFLKLATRF